MDQIRKYFLTDLSASLVVFLVALPLCMGIALASGAPIFSGILSGIVGGIVVGLLSNAQISVSGPAAGLTLIVLDGIDSQGSFNAFLAAVFLAGIIQLLLGIFKVGYIVNFFPHSVIKGMLSAIGLILILKQLPHALGWDRNYEGDLGFIQPDGNNTFTELYQAILHPSPGIVLLSSVSLLFLILWEHPRIQSTKLRLIPSALIVVFLGIATNLAYQYYYPSWSITAAHRVDIPIQETAGLTGMLQFPDWSTLWSLNTYILAITIALIAGLESLLSVEATDKLDPLKRITNPNQELRAQGIGNVICGLVGGIPVTAVIVRSSANIEAGGRTRTAAILHGLWLILSVLLLSEWLSSIPLSSLAAILIFIGFKLISPAQVSSMWRKGYSQFIPYGITIVAILLSNLLAGVLIGIVAGLYFVILKNFQSAVMLEHDGQHYLLKLNKDVSFLNKALIKKKLDEIPHGASVILDGSTSVFIDDDIEEVLENFIIGAKDKEISVELKKSSSATSKLFQEN